MSQRWKKITKKAPLEGKTVLVKTDNKHPRDEYYEASYDEENDRWQFYDRNGVTCREWNGEPTHYKIVSS